MGSLVERTILASFRYPLVVRSVRGRSRWLGLLRTEVAGGCEEEEDGDQTLKHSRVPRSWAVGDGVRAEAAAAVEVTAELEAHWDGVLGGKRRVSFLLVRSLCCARDMGLTPVISSFSGTLTASGDSWGEWGLDSLWSSRAGGLPLQRGVGAVIQTCAATVSSYDAQSAIWRGIRALYFERTQVFRGTAVIRDVCRLRYHEGSTINRGYGNKDHIVIYR